MIQIYTDGSAKGNGQKDSIGGWAIIIIEEDGTIKPTACTNIKGATNNQMELEALNFALLAALIYDRETIIYSDSAYCVNMYNNWVDGWAAHNWHGSKGKEIKNLDIVQAIYKLKQLFDKRFFQSPVTVKKVQGHNGIRYNELVDKLATGELKPEDVQ